MDAVFCLERIILIRIRRSNEHMLSTAASSASLAPTRRLAVPPGALPIRRSPGKNEIAGAQCRILEIGRILSYYLNRAHVREREAQTLVMFFERALPSSTSL
jgi:hypothetical protein